MFEFLYPVQRGRVERLRALKVPLMIGIVIAIPLMVVVHWLDRLEKMGAFGGVVLELTAWMLFPDFVLLVLDRDFLAEPAKTVIWAAVTVVTYAAIACWCRYWIEEGYVEGVVTLRLWRHWPFRIGMGVFVPFFILRIWNFVYNWRLYKVIVADEEVLVIDFFMYLGGMTALLSAIIVIGRRIRARQETGVSPGRAA